MNTPNSSDAIGTPARAPRFIDTNGGPFIVLPSQNLGDWEGADPPADGRIVEATFRWDGPDDPATDYDRACDVNAYVGVIPVGEGADTADAIVLGEDNASVSLWKREPAALPMIVGWSGADSAEACRVALSTLTAEALAALPVLQAPAEFTVAATPSPSLYIFDSAYAGSDTLSGALEDNYLRFELPPGRYRVHSLEFYPDDTANLVLYVFVRIDDGER